MAESPQSPPPGDVDAAVEEYLRRVDAGDVVEQDAFIAKHPNVAPALRSFFANEQLVRQWATSAPPPPGDTATRNRNPTVASVEINPAALANPSGSVALPAMMGRYRVEKELGRGAMGAVYLARDTELDRPVALKLPHFSSQDNPDLIARFLREARSAAMLAHPNICRVYDVSEYQGTRYIAMEFIDGRPLSAYIRGSSIQPRQAASIVRKLALGLAEAHKQGIIHRDLKPDNILINKNGEPVLTDFGLARETASGKATATQDGAILGSPAYMPPEQAAGNLSSMGPSSDVYSLGVVLYEMLTGEVPFRGSVVEVLAHVLMKMPKPVRELRPEIDPALAGICEKMMAKKAADRYQSMTEVAAALVEWIKSPQKTAAPETASKTGAELLSTLGELKIADEEKPKKPAAAPSVPPANAPKTKVPGSKQTLAPGAKKSPVRTARQIQELCQVLDQLLARNDYPEVIRIVEEIPEADRDLEMNGLYADAVELRTKVEKLETDLQKHLNLVDLSALKKTINQLLAIRPSHVRAKELRKALTKHGRQGIIKLLKEEGNFDAVGRVWEPWKIAASVGTVLLVFAAVSLAVTLYLQDDRRTVKIEFDDPTAVVKIDGNVVSINGDGIGKLLLKIGPHQYTVERNDEIIREPQSFEVVKEDRNVLRISVLEKPSESVVKTPQSPAEEKRATPDLMYLSDLQEESVEFWEYKPNWGFNKHGCIGGPVSDDKDEKFTLAGKESPHGIFLHPKPNGRSSLKYQIADLGYETLEATPGVADKPGQNPQSELTFEVYGDGKQLWTSKTRKCGEPLNFPPLNIKGVKALELRVLCPGDGTLALAVWSEPRLLRGSPLANQSANWQPGFLCQIYEGKEFGKLLKTRVDDAIGDGPNFAGAFNASGAAPGLPVDNFSIRWLGAINVKQPGRYTLRLEHDDGGRLWVDDQVVFDRWVNGIHHEEKELDLTAGWHTVRIEYYEDAATCGVNFRWKRPGQELEFLRDDIVSHNPDWTDRTDFTQLGTPNDKATSLSGAPPLAVAPFDAAQAKAYQAAWSNRLQAPEDNVNSLGMHLRMIPPGEFLMGAGDSEKDKMTSDKELPRHKVRITQPFYLSSYETTRGQFAQFVKETGYKTEVERSGRGGKVLDRKGNFVADPKSNWRKTGFPQDDDHPVVNVTAEDAEAFCRWLSEKEKTEYRLPTEAEWEFACRAGTTAIFVSGDQPEDVEGFGNFGDSSFHQRIGEKDAKKPTRFNDGYIYTAPVGKFKPNPFGIYDMLGNAWEHCSDWLGDYPAGDVTDPKGPPTGEWRVGRGGGFDCYDRFSRAATRDFGEITEGNKGFRVAITLKQNNQANQQAAGWQPGFLCQIYDGRDFNKHLKTRVDRSIRINFGLDGAERDLPVDQFSIRWLGAMHVQKTGSYAICLDHDDGGRLWIDDRPVFDNWTSTTSRDLKDVLLTEGWHTVRIDYYEDGATAGVNFLWSPAGAPVDRLEPIGGDLVQHNPAWAQRTDFTKLGTPDGASAAP